MPPLVLLLTPTAFFSWPTAKLIWLICNLALMASIPWLLARLLPEHGLRFSQTLMIALIFFGFSATRVAVWTGQTTLLVFFLMIVALLLHKRNWLVSGILLGVAMSKFTLAVPAFIVMFYRRNYRALAVGVLLHGVALLALSLIAQRSPLAVLESYTQVASRFLIIVRGIHLATLFPQQSDVLVYAILGAGLLLLAWIAAWTPRPNPETESLSHAPVEFHLFTVLCLWVLLVIYHRIYDAAISITFVALLVYGLTHAEVWKLSPRGKLGMLVALVFFVGVQMLPGEIVGRFLPADQTATWLWLVDIAITVSLVAALALSVWLYRRALAVR
jgi:hypothetical protein